MIKRTLLILLLITSAILAQYSATESFNYPVGTSLDTLIATTASGFQGMWDMDNGTLGLGTVVDTSLNYDDLNYPYAHTGNHFLVALPGGWVAARYTSALDKTWPDEAGKVYWMSFLFEVNATPNGNTYYIVKLFSDATELLAVGKGGGGTTFTCGSGWPGGSGADVTTTECVGSTPVMFVVRINMSGDTESERTYMWINPDPSAEPDTNAADAIRNSTMNNGFNNVRIECGGELAMNVNFDEIRLGTSYADVTSPYQVAETIPVTFQVDMSAQITLGGFVPGTNIVVVRGSFQVDAGGVSDWSGNDLQLSDAGNGVYSRVVDIPSAKEGTNYEYKFVIPGATDVWEGNVGPNGTSNRVFTLTGPSQVLPAVYFNNVSATGVTNTFNFTCDMTGIYGSGPGFFDPNVDSVLVMGLDWDGGTAVKGNRRMVEDPFQPGIFHASLTCTQSNVAQDSTSWKFKAYPDGSFTNGGWETGDNNWVHYGADGATIDLPSLVPRIFPALGPTTVDVPVLFSVDMGQNPVNSWDNSAITDVQFVGLKGELVELGSWGGNWVAADTTGGAPPTQTMLVCNDAGLNGDKVAGDHVWSRLVTIAAGVGGGVKEYKFGAMYPGASAAAGTQAHVMDNENGFGLNHQFILHDATAIDLKVTWGIMGLVDVRPVKDAIPVKYDLGQNYPNPFNPSTSIRYSLKDKGMVTLKVYNLIGQEVVTLVNSEQPAGVYEVNFDAGRLTSGVYLYTLSTGNFTQTKKMILMK